MRRFLRLALWAILLLVAAVLLAWATHRDQARAYARAITIGSTLVEVPGASSLTRALTRDPVVLGVRSAGTLDARASRPGGRAGETHPAVVMLVPRDATQEELAGIADAQAALARAGLVAWSVRLPTVMTLDSAIDPGDAVADALVEVTKHPLTRGGSVAIVGAGPGASIGILAAADPRLAGKVSAIVALQPFADVQGVLRLVVTGTTRMPNGRDVPHEGGRGMQRAAARAILGALARAGLDRRAVGVLDRAITVADRPLQPLLAIPAQLLPDDLRPAVAVLTARGPHEFDRAWGDLPRVLRAPADARSPSLVIDRLDAPITFLVPVDDRLLPAADSERLAALAREAHVVRSDLLDPGGPSSLGRADLQPLLGEAVGLLRTIDEA